MLKTTGRCKKDGSIIQKQPVRPLSSQVKGKNFILYSKIVYTMIFKALTSAFYTDQRNQLIQRLRPNSIAIFHSNDKMPLSADQYFPFRQNKTS